MSAARRATGGPHEGAPRRLLLLRHAKSDWSAEGVADHERPLTRRGRHAAERMGEELARRGAAPERILCSSARRARETLELVRARLGPDAAVEFDDRLYLATADELLARIAEVGDDVHRLMLVGHNPGLAELARELVGQAEADVLLRASRGLAPAAFAALRVPLRRWRELEPACAELVAFVRPGDAG